MKRWARSVIFNIAFYGWLIAMCLALSWALLLPRKRMVAVIHVWLDQLIWIARVAGGIRHKVTGREHVPDGACIIAAKHQSAWETFILHGLFGDPAIVLKAELANTPFLGWYMSRSGAIPIDRAGRGPALAKMMRAAHKAADAGRKIVIFPQGTRTNPGEWRPYKSGVAALYQELNVPVVPMALNSGLLWPRNSFLKKPGTITVEFLPPIPPGLPRAEMMERLKTELEAASDRLAR